MSEKPSKILMALNAIHLQITPIAKGKSYQGKSMKVWDIINMLAPLFKEQEIILTQEITDYKTQLIDNKIFCSCTIKFHFVATDGSEVISEGVGIGYNANGKEMNIAQQYAYKYVMMHMFNIPEEIEQK